MHCNLKLLILIFISHLLAVDVIAQTIAVTGKVVSADGTAVPGASVIVKGSKTGTSTADDGTFKISVKPKDVLTVSAIGFVAKETTIAKEGSIVITLEGDSRSMSEVVVTALGIKREKRSLTYSTQELKGDVLTSTKEPGVLNALAGRVSGVQITSSSGQPGSSSRIVIRGATSITGNNEALIVMDGIPINNSQTGNAGPGNGISRLSDIDPEIIESINVLKGSAASALYGSDAARGVVIITTKNGTSRRPQINVSTQASFETPILTDVQDKYAQGTNGIYADGETSKTSEVWGPRIDTLRVNGQPVFYQNPLEAFFQTGKTYTNTVSVGGGVGKSNYYLSYSNLSQAGTAPTSKFNRNVVFGKFTSVITPKITTTFQLNYTFTNSNRIPEGNDIISPLWTVYTAPFTWNPYPIYDANGIQRVFRLSRNNPYWSIENSYNKSRNNRFLPTFNMQITPTNWLTITERLGADIYAETNKYYESPSTILASTGRIEDRSNTFMQLNHDLIVEAKKTFFDDLDVSLMVGNNMFTQRTDANSLSGAGITILHFDNISNASTVTGSQSTVRRRKIGFYAQSNLSYKRLINLSLTGRYDGTSVLADGSNFYPYGSASAGFIFSELLRKSSVISFGKLRASYSSVGNDNIGAYNLETVFSRASSFPYNGRSGFLQSNTLSNANIKNERTNEFEVGLEIQFLKNRIGFEASYFARKGIDLLSSSVALSAATGYTATVLNANSMTNKGVEVLLNVTPVKTKRFSWDVLVNFTQIKNKVTKIYGNTSNQQIGQTYAFVGQPYGVLYMPGLRKDSLGRQIVDANGLPLATTSNVIVGNIQPDWTGGVTNTLKFDNLSFSFFVDMKKGGDILNYDDVYGYFYGTAKATENREDRIVPNSVYVDGRTNTTVVTGRSYFQRLNTIAGSGVQDGTFVKLRNVNISYSLPQKMIAKTIFSSITLTATGRNLIIYTPNFTGPDPETSTYGSGNGDQGFYNYSLPTSRSYNLTLNVGFK